MANMSYCRFRNTFSDLRDCAENWDDPEDLSEEERVAQRKLLDLCQEIVWDHGEDEW